MKLRKSERKKYKKKKGERTRKKCNKKKGKIVFDKNGNLQKK